jgi:hypothetical protein
MLLTEASAMVDERQESVLIIDDRRVSLQLDELPQCVAAVVVDQVSAAVAVGGFDTKMV